MMNRWVIATTRVAGFHRWPDASGQRCYLADRHRHLFHLRIEAHVTDEDREIEFHDLADWLHDLFPNGNEFHSDSCEAIATRIVGHALGSWGDRRYRVEVWEDGENGARIEYDPGGHHG